MARQVREVEEVTQNDNISPAKTKRVVTTTDEGVEREVVERSSESTAHRIVWYIAGVILTLLAFRFILSLLGANRSNGFADFIYAVSYPFVAPFYGLFNYKAQYGVSRFEIETLVAMIFYVVIAAGIVQLIKIVRKEA